MIEPASLSLDMRDSLLATPQVQCTTATINTFRIVGDNIDKTVKPRNMRLDNQARSLHYFNSYAVKDRVNLLHLSPACTIVNSKDINIEKLLPTQEDIQNIKDNICILVSRMLVAHIPALKRFATAVCKHIPHRYATEMANTSTVVS